MASLQLRNVYKVYDGGVRAVSDFNLDIADKEFVVFVGPSGCGKSTTLRMIAGLEEITAGSLFVDGKKVNDVQPKDRNIAMVFQNYALYPHMTVFQNMAFGLKLRKLPMDEITRRVNKAAEILGIEDLLTRKPKALSGGQRQRVALGRAIVREPNVFLLDEPLSNLDAKLRVQMRTEITKLHKKLATTFIYVTHDQTEAMTMGDRIVVMKDGFIQQADTPATLYDEPANVFVATFLGSPQMNVFQAALQRTGYLQVVFGNGNKATFSEVKGRQLCNEEYVGKQVLFGIRPEDISLGTDGIPATVDTVEHLGSETIVYADVDGLQNPVVVKIPTDHSVEAGQNVSLVFNTDKSHLFDEQTSLSIMGVPAVNDFNCVLDGDEIRLENEVRQLPQYFKKKLFSHAYGKQIRMEIATDKVSQKPLPDCIELQLTVDFVATNGDKCAVFCTSTAQSGHFVFRSKRGDYVDGDKITVYVPYDAVSFTMDGVRLNSRFDVPSDTTSCSVKTVDGLTSVHIGGKTLRYPDLGVADGDYAFRLCADKLSFVYNKKYARKNKLHCDKSDNTLAARSYDEDKLGGGKNAVFVRIGGFDGYVTAILDDVFSVYKMPDFPIVVPRDGFELLPLNTAK